MKRNPTTDHGINVDSMPAEANESRRLQPSDAALQSWFKGSKVVDAEGAPLRAYHGTDGDHYYFDSDFIGSGNGLSDWGEGFYFASVPEAANGYAEGAGGNVRVVYLNIQNPANLKVMLSPEVQLALDDDMGFTSTQEVLAQMGYDGIVIEHKSGTEFIVFSNEQVRSVYDTAFFTWAPSRNDLALQSVSASGETVFNHTSAGKRLQACATEMVDILKACGLDVGWKSVGSRIFAEALHAWSGGAIELGVTTIGTDTRAVGVLMVDEIRILLDSEGVSTAVEPTHKLTLLGDREKDKRVVTGERASPLLITLPMDDAAAGYTVRSLSMNLGEFSQWREDLAQEISNSKTLPNSRKVAPEPIPSDTTENIYSGVKLTHS